MTHTEKEQMIISLAEIWYSSEDSQSIIISFETAEQEDIWYDADVIVQQFYKTNTLQNA